MRLGLRHFAGLVPLALLSIAIEAQTHQVLYFSKMRPRSSTLASASYLFHGLPNGVVGSSFTYHTMEGFDCESMLDKYIASNKDAPNKRFQLSMRLWDAVYVCNGKPVLVLTKDIRIDLSIGFDSIDIARAGYNERLVVASQYGILRKLSIVKVNEELESVKLPFIVSRNIESLAANASVVSVSHNNYTKPFPVR